MSKEKTVKRKNLTVNKIQLWNNFDCEIKDAKPKIDPLECIYRSCGTRENCERCESNLAF